MVGSLPVSPTLRLAPEASIPEASVCWLLLLTTAIVILLSAQPQPQNMHKGFIYQPATGGFWDPTVIYFGGKYYLFAMYGGDSVWLATSGDGVRWKDYGVVLKSQGFKSNRVWKPFVAKVGDKFI